MIIDYKADSRLACMYHPVDAETGEAIDFPIAYADDEKGVIRFYKRAGPHVYVKDPSTGGPIIIEERRKIRLVPTDGNPLKDDILHAQRKLSLYAGDSPDDVWLRTCIETELEALFWQVAYLKQKELAGWMREERDAWRSEAERQVDPLLVRLWRWITR